MARFTFVYIWICVTISMISGASAAFGITGIQSGRGSDGSVPLRLEIRQLQKNVPQWNLYILALKRLEKFTDQTTLLSYYQIAGIHGRPYVPWDDSQPAEGQEDWGYCMHGITLFPTWHRPYVALYEQILYGIVQTIAQEPPFAGRSGYASAASTFRVPYWDWAQSPPSGQQSLPSAVSGSEWIMMSLPNGTFPVANPLYQYRFNPLTPSDFPNALFNEWNNTLRAPTSETADATSQNDLVAAELTSSQTSYRATLMNLFQVNSTYGPFSNTEWNPGEPNEYNSVEALHNNIHNTMGSGGHMSYPDYASFDPIFWLHHANVDRVFAIWQALWPNSYVPSSQAGSGTYTITEGQTLDENTPLAPFHKDSSGNFWTSASVRSTGTFGYSYPELLYWKYSRPGPYTTAVKKAVNAAYKGSGVTLRRRNSTEKKPTPKYQSIRTYIASGFRSVHKSPKENPQKEGHDNTYQEWIANIRVAKYALEGSFNVYIFLGDFNPNPTSWALDPNFVGMHSVFANNMSTQHEKIVTGTVPLTEALEKDTEAGKLVGDSLSDIDAYLTQNLHWRVAKVDKTEVPRSDVSSLKVSVISVPVTPAERDDEFPCWGNFEVHRDITTGRPAGLGEDDQA